MYVLMHRNSVIDIEDKKTLFMWLGVISGGQHLLLTSNQLIVTHARGDVMQLLLRCHDIVKL